MTHQEATDLVLQLLLAHWLCSFSAISWARCALQSSFSALRLLMWTRCPAYFLFQSNRHLLGCTLPFSPHCVSERVGKVLPGSSWFHPPTLRPLTTPCRSPSCNVLNFLGPLFPLLRSPDKHRISHSIFLGVGCHNPKHF